MNKKILIAEDEKATLTLLSTLFGELEGYDVINARDGEEALKRARADKPDIILLDVQMPIMNGYDVCRLVKADPATSHIKVLMLTSTPQDIGRSKGKKAGADDYVAKPFSPKVLAQKVEELLKRD